MSRTIPEFAFPVADGSDDGMTLRDYFAAKAMQAFVSIGLGRREEDMRRNVTDAYKYADLMMERRSKL